MMPQATARSLLSCRVLSSLVCVRVCRIIDCGELEGKSALFSLALTDIMMVNMWMHEVRPLVCVCMCVHVCA